MNDLESMARRINELNVKNKAQDDWIMLLESFVYNTEFRVDLDGDAILYPSMVFNGSMDFQTLMTAIQNHRNRFGITEDTHGK